MSTKADLPPFVRLSAIGARILTIDNQSHARGRGYHPCTRGNWAQDKAGPSSPPRRALAKLRC